MPARTNAAAVRRLRGAAVDAAWVQWHALGGQVAGRPSSIVDPEALLLATVALAGEEPRLRDMLSGFTNADTRRISVQRLRSMASGFPPRVSLSLGRVAQGIVAAGDRRWARLASGPAMEAGRPGKVASAEPRLMEESSLMLRLRAAFGVDARADVLTFLLGSQGEVAGIRAIRTQLGYATNSISGACESLREAGLITARPERPILYRLRREQWQQFLGIAEPSWQPWYALYSLALNLHDWLVEQGDRAMSGDVDRMLAREWAHTQRHALELVGLEVEAIAGFAELAGAVAGRLEMAV